MSTTTTTVRSAAFDEILRIIREEEPREAKNIFDDGAERLIIGSGQHGKVKLSDEAQDYFQKRGCSVDLHPTPKAIQVWNEAEGKVIGMFHVTC